MATLNLGRIKPVFRGAYAGGTAYVVDDIVTSGNETFICILASTGNATSNATYWTKLAAKGTDGTDGTDVGTTITTQGDILYRDGSGLQRLAKPASNKMLQNTSGGVLSWESVTSDYVKIQTTTLGSGTTTWSVDGFTDAAYTHYCLYLNNMRSATNGAWYYGRWNIAGSTWTGSDYRSANASSYASSVGHKSGNPDNFFAICQNSTDANRAGSSIIHLYSPAETGRYTFHTITAAGGDGSTNPMSMAGGGFLQKQEAVTGISIIDSSGGNVETGSITIYGIKG